MSRVEIQKIPESSDRSLPILAEFDKLAERIRVKAYNLFRHRGAGEGQALDDWLAAEREVCWPAAELAEADGQYSLKVALAGFEPDDITVTATPSEIMVKAAHEQRQSGADDAARLKWSEFRSNDVYRRVELPDPIDVDKISASLSNGLLEVTAPKAAARPDAEQAEKIALSTPS
jgi:HSP20 family molecular chaperone IbpA